MTKLSFLIRLTTSLILLTTLLWLLELEPTERFIPAARTDGSASSSDVSCGEVEDAHA